MDSWHFPAACSLEINCKATSLAGEENGQGVHGPKEQQQQLEEEGLLYQTVLGSFDLIFIQRTKGEHTL